MSFKNIRITSTKKYSRLLKHLENGIFSNKNVKVMRIIIYVVVHNITSKLPVDRLCGIIKSFCTQISVAFHV